MALSHEELSEEKFIELMDALDAADEAGDEERACEIRKQIPFAAPALMAAKKSMGADWIRKRCYNTTLADEKYGEGWLDR